MRLISNSRGQLLLGQPRAGRVVEQADAVAQRPVDALERVARGAQGRSASSAQSDVGGHPASITALRNCRVRSFCGLPKSSAGGPCSQILPLIEEADPVGELPGEAHLVGDHQHGQVVLRAEAGG